MGVVIIVIIIISSVLLYVHRFIHSFIYLYFHTASSVPCCLFVLWNPPPQKKRKEWGGVSSIYVCTYVCTSTVCMHSNFQYVSAQCPMRDIIFFSTPPCMQTTPPYICIYRFFFFSNSACHAMHAAVGRYISTVEYSQSVPWHTYVEYYYCHKQ